MRYVGRLLLRIGAFTCMVLCMLTGMFLGKGLAYLAWTWMHRSSEDQMVASLVPSILGIAVGFKTYRWLEARMTLLAQRRDAQADCAGQCVSSSGSEPPV
jgi:hypothetical protein